jgi:hypothetical protein
MAQLEDDDSEMGWESPGPSPAGVRTPVPCSDPEDGWESLASPNVALESPAAAAEELEACSVHSNDGGYESIDDAPVPAAVPEGVGRRRGRPRREERALAVRPAAELARVDPDPDPLPVWARNKARTLMLEGVHAMPAASTDESNMIVAVLADENPLPFGESASGKSFKYIWEQKLEREQALRGSSWISEAVAAGLPESQIRTYKNSYIEAAEMLYQGGRIFVAGLARRIKHYITTGVLEGIMLLTYSLSDEASSRLRVPYEGKKSRAQIPAVVAGGGRQGPSSRPSLEVVAETAKVVQTEMGIGFLCRITQSGEYKFITSMIPTCLQAVDRGTTETLNEVHRQLGSSCLGMRPGAAQHTGHFLANTSVSKWARSASP